MTEPRVRTELWVQAQLRRCDINNIPLIVRRRGDPDAGAIVLLVNRPGKGVLALSQTRDLDGRPAWMRPLGAELVDEAKAEEFVARTIKRDPDVWVIEVEDHRASYAPDGPIL
ncbi:MAG: DUF1491 family protein [Gemmatimonas sp.]